MIVYKISISNLLNGYSGYVDYSSSVAPSYSGAEVMWATREKAQEVAIELTKSLGLKEPNPALLEKAVVEHKIYSSIADYKNYARQQRMKELIEKTPQDTLDMYREYFVNESQEKSSPGN